MAGSAITLVSAPRHPSSLRQEVWTKRMRKRRSPCCGSPWKRTYERVEPEAMTEVRLGRSASSKHLVKAPSQRLLLAPSKPLLAVPSKRQLVARRSRALRKGD